MVSRKYSGFVVVDKAYLGEKTINFAINNDEGKKLSQLVSQASGQTNIIDLKLDLDHPRKDGRYTLTVTYI